MKIHMCGALSMFAGLLFTSIPCASAATMEDPEPLPFMVVAAPLAEYPDPMCSKCILVMEKKQQSGGAQADLLIAYPNDENSFEGDIEVSVLLTNGAYKTVWVNDVKLDPSDEAQFTVNAGSTWSWDNARFVWLRFIAD